MLGEILGRIGWGFQAKQGGDRTPPPPPSTLRKWRWRIAQEILAFGKHAESAGGLKDTDRPFALDWSWAVAPEEAITLGQELLPTLGFENGLAPWRVEAWKGTGKGELDTTERHGGEKAVRLTVPREDGNSAVTPAGRLAVRSTQPLENPSMPLGSTVEFERFVGTVAQVAPPSVETMTLA